MACCCGTKSSWLTGCVAAVAVPLVLAGSLGFAQPAGDAKMPAQPPEMDAEMKAWMEAGMPGENHALLATMAGDWDAVVTSYEGPQPERSKGKQKSVMELDGRFLTSHYKGEMMGMPFHGMGSWGYNNVTKKFESTWMDSMMTGIMISYGTYDKASKSFTMTGEMDDPVSGGKVKIKEVFKVVDANKYTMDFFMMETDGTEMKTMDIVYTRSAGETAKPATR